MEYIIDTITDEQLQEAFCAAKEANIAAEINTSCFLGKTDEQIRNGYMFRILSQAKKVGCKFTFGSDSHEDGAQLDLIEIGTRVADMMGLTQEDILEF